MKDIIRDILSTTFTTQLSPSEIEMATDNILKAIIEHAESNPLVLIVLPTDPLIDQLLDEKGTG